MSASGSRVGLLTKTTGTTLLIPRAWRPVAALRPEVPLAEAKHHLGQLLRARLRKRKSEYSWHYDAARLMETRSEAGGAFQVGLVGAFLASIGAVALQAVLI